MSSCNDSDSPDSGLSVNPPQLPVETFFDVNTDGVADFSVTYSYYTWDGLGVSGDGARGALKPLGQNLLLMKSNEKLFFLEFNETISADPALPLQWTTNPYTAVDIQTVNNKWPKQWTPSAAISGSYYIGFKLKVGDAYKLGWAKLDINTSTGSIALASAKLATGSSISVGK